MKHHLSVDFWEKLFEKIEANNIKHRDAIFTLGLCSRTFYVKRRQWKEGGVKPRKPGSGRKRIYHAEAYEPMIRDVLRDMPPVVGHRRIWIALKRRGAKFSQGTAYRMMRELGLLVPKRKGRCRKKYKPIEVDKPNEVWVADTTSWKVGRKRYEVFLCIDAYSRFALPLVASTNRSSDSTRLFYERIFDERMPMALHTDNGKEFDNRDCLAYLEEMGIEWRHGPTYTPEAQGLVERLVKTLKEEFLEWEEPQTIEQLQECLDRFRNYYNRMRDHSALNYQVPEAVYYAGT